ncbi:MAG TPA: helix-turn-helix domain-containing protein [Symbiobacteriaceae bacterium]|nr:helix-turn-helix domain-containing protein [Symbiobacteriaceae bacterium]
MSDEERPQSETLGERVKRLRESRGWNRKELAERAGLNPSHIGLIERAIRVGVRPDTLEKIAAAFGIPVARLRGEETSSTGPTGSEDLEPYRDAIEAARQFGLDPDRLLQLINTTGTLFAKK